MADPARHPTLALSSTLAGQSLGSLCLSAAAVVAPVVAPAIGHAPESVGLFVGAAYLVAMLSGLQSGRGVAWFGAVGLTQVALVSAGIAMAAVPMSATPPFGHALFLLGIAALIGIGYGFLNPTAAMILDRHTPPAHRALFFSIKQAGVPIGVALAGATMPIGLALWGWQVTCWVVAGVCLATACALAPARRLLEPERFVGAADPTREQPRVFKGTGLARVLGSQSLRLLVLTSFAFAFAQLCFLTFLVSYLNLGLGHSLAAAAGVLAISQVVSTGARVAWGAIADRWIPPCRLLGLLGIGSALSLVLLGALGHLSPAGTDGPSAGFGIAVITLVGVVTAVTTMSWNGVYIAALAQRCQPGELASVTGASQFVTFAGSTLGPVTFGFLVRAGLSYDLTYLLVAVLPAIGGIALLCSERQAAAAAGPASPGSQTRPR